MPKYNYGIPAIRPWAGELSKELGTLGFGIDYRILEGEFGEFARFQIKSGMDQLILDLAPGPISEFGRTFEMVYQSSASALLGAEVIASAVREKEGDPFVPAIELRDPLTSLKAYINETMMNADLRRAFPHDPARRLGLLLYEGMGAGGGVVAGGLPTFAEYHTEIARQQMAGTVAVGIDPRLRNRADVYEAIYHAATAAAVGDPSSALSRLIRYAPHKESQSITRLRQMGIGAGEPGVRGEFDYQLLGLSKQGVDAAKAAGYVVKRHTLTYGGMGVRERAYLYGLQEGGKVGQMEPSFIRKGEQHAGYYWLNAIAPGGDVREAAYVRPGVVFTPASPVSGAGFLYGPEGFDAGTGFAAIHKKHRVALPPIGIPNIPSMGLEFGIFRRIEGPEGIEYERQAELEGYALGAGESAIVGLMKYRAKTGEEILQELTYASGTSPTVFRGLPSMKIPPQYHIGTGEGMSGFAKNIGAPTFGIAAAAKEKFGLDVYTSTPSGIYLDFPIAMGVGASGKSFAVKAAWQQMTRLTGGMAQPEVEIAGRKMLVSGMTGELKERITHFGGLFYGMTPEQQIMAVGEFATAPGATQQDIAMADAMQRYLKKINAKYLAGGADPAAVKIDVLGEIYSAYTGKSYTSDVPYQMFNRMRGLIERKGYEATALARYGHAMVEPHWYPVDLGSREEWRLWRQSALEGVELMLSERGMPSLATLEGRRAARALGIQRGEWVEQGGARYWNPLPDVVRWNREQTQQRVSAPWGQRGGMGELEFRSRGLYSSLITYLTPEYMTKLAMMGAEERASLMIANPELAAELGLDTAPGGSTLTGYGFTPTHVEGWRQIGEVARAQLQRRDIEGPIRPVNAIDITDELSAELLDALNQMTDLKKADLGVLESIIESRYGSTGGVLWNPRTRRAFPRPGAIEATATAEFPGGTPYYNPLSTLSTHYGDALAEFIKGEQKQGSKGGLPRQLSAFYREIGQIFESSSHGVEKILQGEFLGGSYGGRYNFQVAAGFNTVVMQTSAMNQILRNLANVAGLEGETRAQYFGIANEQLRFLERFPGLLERQPIVQKPGGVVPVWLTTTDVMRRKGLHFPEATQVSRGRVTPGSVFATGIAFSAGSIVAKLIGDWDLDPGMVTLLAQAAPELGVLITQNPQLHRLLNLPTRQQVREMRENIAFAMGKRGIVAGGAMNVLASGMADVLTTGRPELIEAGKDPMIPSIQNIPREMIWGEGIHTVGAVSGMGIEYNTRRMLEASASALGWEGSSTAFGHTAGGLRYQEYLDKIRGTLRDVTTMLGSAIWSPEKGSGNLQLIAKMGQERRWTPLFTAYHQTGDPSVLSDMANQMALALDRDWKSMSEPTSGGFAAFAMAQREKDIPRLMQWIQEQGNIRDALFNKYMPFLEERGITYDPTQTPLGLSIVAQATMRGEGWYGRPQRTIFDPNLQKEVPTMISFLAQQSFVFQGQRTQLQGISYTGLMRAVKAGYGYLTRKAPPTPGEIGSLLGMAMDLESQGRPLPTLWQQMLGRYPAEQEAQAVAEASLRSGKYASDFPDRTPYVLTEPPDYKVPFQAIDTLQMGDLSLLLKKRGRGYQTGGSPFQWNPEEFWSIVGERGAEVFEPSTPGAVYPSNVLAGADLGMLQGGMGLSWLQRQQLGSMQQDAAMRRVMGSIPFSQVNIQQMAAQAAVNMLIRNARPTMEETQQAMTIQMYRSSATQSPAGAISLANRALAARQQLIARQQSGRPSAIMQRLGEIAGQVGTGLQNPEDVLKMALEGGQLEALETLYRSNAGEVRAGARAWQRAMAFQQVRYHTALEGNIPTGELERMGTFLSEIPVKMEERMAQQAGRGMSALYTLAQVQGWTTGGTGKRVATAEDFAQLGDEVRKAAGSFAELNKVIEDAPESVAAQRAIAQKQKIRGQLAQKFLGAQLPGLQEDFEVAMAAAEVTGDYSEAFQRWQTLDATEEAYSKAARQGRGGMRAGTQASRFMRGLIGGWGLMYMGHLAQFPMAQAQFGFAEAEQFATQMAQYAGGQLGPGVQPFPSIQMQMQQAQIAYGGQGYGAIQLAQANMAPFLRDISGMGLAAAAGGAGALYFGSVATQAGLTGLGAGFTAMALPAAIAAAGAYGIAQVSAWEQQPAQTQASALISRIKSGSTWLPGEQAPQGLWGFDMSRTPGPGGFFQQLSAEFRESMGMQPQTRYQYRALERAYRRFEQGVVGAFEYLGDDQLAIAAQAFAGTMREGLDPTLGGQAFLRLEGIATGKEMEDVVWAQMRGIQTPELAAGLLQASRQPLTKAAAGELELAIKSQVPDMFAAAELQAGTQIMGNLPVNLLRTMYGENMNLINTAQNLAPWARSDMASLLMNEGQLQHQADLFGLQRSRTNIAALERVRRGEATPQEIRALSVAQARETRAQSIATQIGYYAPEFAQGAFTSAQYSPQAEGMWQSAAAGMAQASMLGISAGRFLGQMTGRGVQGNLLGQQALGMTQQYAMWGGQQTSQFFGAVSSDLGSQIFAQRLMRMDPFAIAEAAQRGVPGMAQFATTVDVSLGGDITGLPWGTTSLARVGRSAESVAQGIWGNRWQGTGWGEAAVSGFTTPFGQRVGGTRGLQWYMRSLQWEQQQASMGVAAAQIALQEEYMPQFWAIQDQQRALSHEQSMYGFGMQQRQFALQGQQFTEQMGLTRRGQLMQRGWAMQDWAWQDQTRAMQWQWRQEDFAENIRFMSGRERRLAERQMERETTMFGMEGERIDEQRSRQKEMWALEDARFEMQKKHFNETRQLQEENMEKQKEFYLEGKKLQDEMIKLQREYQMKQLELQKAAIGVQTEYAQKMKEAQDAMMALGDEQEDNNARWKLAQSRQVELINTIIRGVNHIIEHAPDAFASILNGDGQKIPLFSDSTGGGGGAGKGNYVPMAAGGPSMPGRYTVVGDAGIELMRSSVPQHVFPSNETFAAMLGGAENMLNDPWAQTIVGIHGSRSPGTRTPTTIVINIGNERLGEFVLNTVNNALEVH